MDLSMQYCCPMGQLIYIVLLFQLAHPILESLRGSDRDWLVQLLFAFNSGNIARFDELKSFWGAQVWIISTVETQLASMSSSLSEVLRYGLPPLADCPHGLIPTHQSPSRWLLQQYTMLPRKLFLNHLINDCGRNLMGYYFRSSLSLLKIK